MYLRVRLTALKWFEIVPGKHRKRDVTTVFAYSHLNTPIDQCKCAYCLKHFIIGDNNLCLLLSLGLLKRTFVFFIGTFCFLWALSKGACEAKSNCCLFERLFKVKKNGVNFSFWNISFRFRDIYLFYYANEESDDIIGGAIKTVQHSIKNI